MHGTECPRPPKLAYRIDDACYVAGIGKTTLYKLAAKGKLRLLKIGRRRLVDAKSLRALIEAAR